MPSQSTPIHLQRLDHIVVRVCDVARSLKFYCDGLGMTEERRLPEYGLIQLRAGQSLIDLVELDSVLGRAGGEAPGVGGRNVDHFALEVERFDEEAIRGWLSGHGIEAGDVARRYGARGFGPSMYIHDPDGNVVELKGPPEE